MYPVSPGFLTAIRRGGTRRTVADLYFNQQLVKADIPISDWSINAHSESAIRVSGSCTVVDPTLVPTLFSDSALLVPAGSEIHIRTGFVFGNSEELIPLGVFTIESVKWKDGKSSAVQVEFFDRGKILERYNITGPVEQSGWWVQRAISGCVTSPAPEYLLPPIFDPTLSNFRLPGGTTYDSDRLAMLKTLGDLIGAEVSFNRSGQAICQKTPNITEATSTAAAVWTIDVGENGVLIDADKGLSRSGVYNNVRVYGASPDTGKAQVYAESYDLNTQSPTYYNGPFGRVRQRFENSALTTYSQCKIYADSLIAHRTGLAKSVDFQLVPNPALDIGDIILAKYLDGTQELHVIDSYQLSNSSMSAKTRAIQWIEVG